MNGDRLQRLAATNPFSSTAVAMVSGSASEMVSVDTESIAAAIRHVEAYLSANVTGAATVRNVLAIAGDYGTGKTHLAARLIDRIRNRSHPELRPDASISSVEAEEQVRVVYLIATAGTFMELYRALIDRLPQAEVSSRVREYYADIAASKLEDSQLAEQIKALLREAGTDARDVTSRLGLSESDLLQELRQQLTQVTMNEAFAVVLSLLLRPGFGEAAWRWLRGGQPDPLLVERGITSAIDHEAAALEAMGILALLYGRQNRRFVLIIDELDKLLPDPPSRETILAFRNLLTVFAEARALLLLIGLDEFFDLIPDIRRFGYVVSMIPFDGNITRHFIEKCQMAASEKETLLPFTPEAVAALVGLTGGNPRRIQLYCGQLFRMATSQKDMQRHVTIKMVHDVARTHYTVTPKKDLADVVRRTLESQGWEPLKDYYVSTSMLHRVDLWVPMGTESAGCAILLADAVIEPADMDELKARVGTIRTAVEDCETLLIVSGPLAPPNVSELISVFGREPLIYDAYSFSEDFTSIMKAMSHRFERMAGTDAIARVQKRVENVSEQLSRTQHSLLQLITHVHDFKSSSDQGFGLIRRELDNVARAVVAKDEPPTVINRLFEERLRSLEQLGTAVTLIADAFVVGSGSELSARDTMASIRGLLHDSDSITRALGAVDLLSATTQAFRRGVVDWFRSHSPSGQTRLRPKEKGELETLCLIYETIYELLPLYELQGLVPVAETLDSRSAGQTQTRHEYVNDVRQQFEYLGAEVRRIALNLLSQ